MGKKQIHKFGAQWLFSLPNDLLVFLFLYLREKELCCLDSAILNHPERTLFLSVLRQRFREGTCLISILVKSWESKCCWFLRRNIPISFLLCCKTDRLEEEMISMNSSTLTTINLNGCSITHKNALALGHCSKLKSLILKHCSLPLGFDIASIFATLTTLEDFKLDQGSFTGIAVENLSRYCSSLKFLSLSTVVGFGDDDLRCIVDGCHSLCSLTLSHLSITDESVRIILEHHRRIPTVGINFCDGVNLERISRLLRETTIPQLFGSNVKIQLAAIANFSFSIPFHHPDSTVQTIELISEDSLLVRMVEHLSSNAQLRPKIMDFIWHFCSCGGFLIIVNFGIPSILFQHLNSFDECELIGVFVILKFLLDHVNYHEYILSSGFLSIFRTRISALMDLTHMLLALSHLISESVVPIEEWIKTVSFLIYQDLKESKVEQDDRKHSTIQSICMRCTSPSHVASLLEEGILDYWKLVLSKDESVYRDGVLQSIAHLTSIDNQLCPNIQSISKNSLTTLQNPDNP